MRAGPHFPPSLDLDLAGLCKAAAPWLAHLPVTDQRIQATPDERTLRYYQTTGLLDRPVRYEGRIARYGRRHLLQVLVVRLLQSEGLSLAQVQTALAGASDAELATRLEVGLGVAAGSGLRTPNPIPVQAASSAFTAVELSPGVVVTVDSRFHTDPARVIELLRRAIQGDQS